VSWSIHYKPAAGRTLTETLPEVVAAAARQLIEDDLRNEPFRVGKPLEKPSFRDRTG